MKQRKKTYGPRDDVYWAFIRMVLRTVVVCDRRHVITVVSVRCHPQRVGGGDMTIVWCRSCTWLVRTNRVVYLQMVIRNINFKKPHLWVSHWWQKGGGTRGTHTITWSCHPQQARGIQKIVHFKKSDDKVFWNSSTVQMHQIESTGTCNMMALASIEHHVLYFSEV